MGLAPRPQLPNDLCRQRLDVDDDLDVVGRLGSAVTSDEGDAAAEARAFTELVPCLRDHGSRFEQHGPLGWRSVHFDQSSVLRYGIGNTDDADDQITGSRPTDRFVAKDESFLALGRAAVSEPDDLPIRPADSHRGGLCQYLAPGRWRFTISVSSVDAG